MAGYLDEVRPLRDKIVEELAEELGLAESAITQIHYGEPHEYLDPDTDKTWLIHPVLVELSGKPQVTLDWEHTDFAWIEPGKINSYEIVPMLDETLRRALEAIDVGSDVR